MSAIVFAFAVTFYQYMSLGKSEGLYAILRYMVIVYFCVSLIIIVVIFFLCSYRAHDMYNKLTNNKTIKMEENRNLESQKKISVKDIFKAIIYYIYPKVYDIQKAVLFIIGWMIGIVLLPEGTENFFEQLNIRKWLNFYLLWTFVFIKRDITGMT